MFSERVVEEGPPPGADEISQEAENPPEVQVTTVDDSKRLATADGRVIRSPLRARNLTTAG